MSKGIRQTAAVIVLTFLSVKACFAQENTTGRISYTINDGWRFLPDGQAYAADSKRDVSDWEMVSLPHTWNAKDAFDKDKTYKRSLCWYRKELKFSSAFRNKRIYILFEGAYQVADVFINGAFAARHKGGYTAFSVDITDLIRWQGDSSVNTIAVQVNSAHDPFIPPLSIGYAMYGGIYRDVWVIATDQFHFREINNNAAGVYITTPAVSLQKATWAVRTTIVNESAQAKQLRFRNTLYDKDNREVATIEKTVTLTAGEEQQVIVNGDAISNPHLWSPEDPYCYHVKSQVIAGDKITDEVQNVIGFRWFSFSADNGFSLNGKRYILNGTTCHQDRQGKGDALSIEDHEQDMQLIKDMGCNFIRLAHYPQAPEVLQLADRLGLLIWEEVPVVNNMNVSPEFLHNGEYMIREMIQQGYNHPSVVLWGSMNEVLLYGKGGSRVVTHTDTAYLSVVRHFGIQLDSTIRAEDAGAGHYTTVAMHLSTDYEKFGLDKISQVVGHNIYLGWYSGEIDDLGKELDRVHASEPDQIMFISEFGAEGEIQLNTENPVRMDYSTEYQRHFHESYIRQIRERPYLAGVTIWNEFDFSQPNIGGPTPHRNQKGLITWDRKPKDTYFLYKANWNPEPMVYIASRNWLVRAGEAGALSTIDVYSNLDAITLSVNGRNQPLKKPDDIRKASWQVQLADGKNIIIASGKKNGIAYHDEVVIDYHVYTSDFSKVGDVFHPVFINVGSGAQYLDPTGNVWIEDRPYTKGGFGYISGKSRNFSRGEVIFNTNDIPLYYTYRDSLTGYRLDVPDGYYTLTLFFAESEKINRGERVFDVSVNDRELIHHLDLAGDYGFAEAIRKSFVVEAKGGQGITLSFDAIKGKTLLSGIKLDKK